MDDQGLPRGPLERIELLAGGTQNVLVRFARAGREYVLRRGPRHLRPKSNDALRREARVLAALADTDVPHPRFIAGCLDESVMGGAVFYLMEPVDGFNPTTGLPALHASDPAIRHEMGLEAADAIARLGRVDHLAVGLADFGRPEGFLERQVPRWLGGARLVRAPRGLPRPRDPRCRAGGDVARPTSPGHVDTRNPARRLPPRQRDVRLRRAAARRDRRLGDVHDRRPAARPRLAARHVA